MDITRLPEFDNHELVSFIYDPKTGLRGFIAIHNTNLGPATGGTRYWRYASDEEALKDVLRLSRAMTYKCALAGVPYGGGKAVITSNNPNAPKTKSFLAEYAQRINFFRGGFYTGEDVGMNKSDIAFLTRRSPYINGRPKGAGDLGRWTALGVMAALQGGLKAVFKDDRLIERSFAFKGLGKVGIEVLSSVCKSGAKNIFVADINEKALVRAKKKFPFVRVVNFRKIHGMKVDVYSPNALGNEFTTKNISSLHCKLICGAANNQLESVTVGKLLHHRGILYLPDYVVNAGGLISIMAEVGRGGFQKEKVTKKISAIQKTAERIIESSKRTRVSTSEVADRLSRDIFSKR